jgi:hypothetical protein
VAVVDTVVAVAVVVADGDGGAVEEGMEVGKDGHSEYVFSIYYNNKYQHYIILPAVASMKMKGKHNYHGDLHNPVKKSDSLY